MSDIAAIAASHGIEPAELTKWVTGHGWDFSGLDVANQHHVDFATKVVAGYAADIAARHAKIAAARANRAAREEARLTPAARQNPAAICFKCSGKGAIFGFSHIEHGTCFACGGSGVRAARLRRQG